MAMFACFGSGHLHDFAGTSFDHDEAILAERGALDRVGGRGSGGCHIMVLFTFHLKSASGSNDTRRGQDERWSQGTAGLTT